MVSSSNLSEFHTQVSRTRLVDLPDDQSFTVDDFVHNQHDHIEVEVDVLTGKNLEIEAAVDDLVQVRSPRFEL